MSKGFPISLINLFAFDFSSLKFIPIILIFLFLLKLIKCLCSFLQGAHQDAQKLIKVKLFFFKSRVLKIASSFKRFKSISDIVFPIKSLVS